MSPPRAAFPARELRDDGCAVIAGALDPERCAALGRAVLAAWERLEAAGQGFSGPGRRAGNLNLALGEAGAFLLPALDGLRRAAGEAFGVELVATQLGGNFNLPGSVAQDFHRDADDAAVRIVANVGLVEGTCVNGPIAVVPGSAALAGYARFHRAGWPARARLRPLAPGDVLLRRAQLWHRGTANRSREARPMAALVMVEAGVAAGAPDLAGPIRFLPNRFYGRFPAAREWAAVHAPWLPHLLRYAGSRAG